MNYTFVALLVLCTLYALWAGGGPERVGAAVYALSVAATHLILTAQSRRWLSFEEGVFIVDLVTFLDACLLGGWIAIAWRLRAGYVRTIHESIHQHRIDSERLPAGGVDPGRPGLLAHAHVVR